VPAPETSRPLIRTLHQLVCWLVLPLAVGCLLYAALWQRYEEGQAAAETLPAPLAKQFALLPPPVSTLVALLFVASDDQAQAVAKARLEAQVLGVDASALRLRAAPQGARGVAITYRAGNRRTGCVVLLLPPDPRLRVAYAPSSASACRAAGRSLERSP
jgi:hypothetical protein